MTKNPLDRGIFTRMCPHVKAGSIYNEAKIMQRKRIHVGCPLQIIAIKQVRIHISNNSQCFTTPMNSHRTFVDISLQRGET